MSKVGNAITNVRRIWRTFCRFSYKMGSMKAARPMFFLDLLGDFLIR